MGQDNDTATAALARWIASQLPRFNYSELKTVAVRVERLGRAKAQYGDDFDLATDRRNFKLEAAYEGVDEKWYDDAAYVFDHDPAFADIRAQRKAERIAAFKHADDMPSVPAVPFTAIVEDASAMLLSKWEDQFAEEPTGLYQLNRTGDECEHCSAPDMAPHRSGCQWSTVVPAPATEVA